MLLRSITLKRLLSFRDCTLDLRPLNIIIGANASGKSNLASALSLLQAAPGDIEAPIRWGGGVEHWIGKRNGQEPAEVSCDASGPEGLLRYGISFVDASRRFRIETESLRAVAEDSDRSEAPVVLFGRFQDSLNVTADTIVPIELPPSRSAFSVLKGPPYAPAAVWLGGQLEAIRIYRSFDTGPRSPMRQGIAPASLNEQLDPRGDNLALVLDDLKMRNGGFEAFRRIRECMERFWEDFDGLDIGHFGGILTLYTREKELEGIIPASRLSDGTLRFLCLMTVLLHPEPGPLICLEEPEAGLHPDAVRILAEALEEASERTQVIVTTQSPELVNAFSHDPAAVVVCERGFERETTFHRLVPEELESWLEAYSLGEVWRKGEIGGNRW